MDRKVYVQSVNDVLTYPPTPEDGLTRQDISVEGMTCAACAQRIERGLGRLDGVTSARVNFATGRATVVHSRDVSPVAIRDTVEALGYGIGSDDVTDVDGENARERLLRQRLIVAAVLSVPAMVISMAMPLHFDGWEWVVAALTTPVVFWSGWPFHRATLMNLRHRSTTMDTLVSMGTMSAWTWSMVVLVGGIGDGHVYFETAAVIVTLILLGKWWEARATRRSGDALRALAGLEADTARLEDGSDIPVGDLAVGDRFLVRPGEKVATDGVVVEGRASIDSSMITGEPMPVDTGPGDEVIGATINVNGSLVVEASRVGPDTALSAIVRLVEEAQGSRADVQRLADRVASVFVPAAIATSALTLIAWLATGHPLADAFTAAVAVLIIACPCALGLATPLAIMVGTGRAAQLGVIIKGGEILEDTRAVDTIVLDKTGTVTEGRMRLAEVITAPDTVDESELIALAAAVESRSEHPIAAAVTEAAPGSRPVSDFLNRPGVGVTGTVGSVDVRVGTRALFDSVPATIVDAAAAAESLGRTVVFAGRGPVAEAALVIADRIKPTSAAAVAAFHDQGLSVTLLSGDNLRAVEAVGSEVGVDRVIAEVLPDEKIAEIRRLQAEGHRVAMVGDGINDAPALAQADLGIAVGTGTDVAIEASDLTVVTGDLRGVADAIALSRRTFATIKGNLFWAFAYNIAAIPLAALGVLNPMVAAAAMGLSSLFVVTNSLRLRRFSGYRSRGPAPEAPTVELSVPHDRTPQEAV